MLTSGLTDSMWDRFFLPNFGELWRESSPDAYIWNPRPKQHFMAALREGEGLPKYKCTSGKGLMLESSLARDTGSFSC